MFNRFQRDEEGFTLIELLVVVIIIGILAAVAIPTFLNQRRNGWNAAVQSDVRNAAIEMESAATANSGQYPLAIPAGLVSTTGVTVTYTAGTAAEFCLTGTHASDATIAVIYDSDDGGIADNTAGC